MPAAWNCVIGGYLSATPMTTRPPSLATRVIFRLRNDFHEELVRSRNEPEDREPVRASAIILQLLRDGFRESDPVVRAYWFQIVSGETATSLVSSDAQREFTLTN